MPSFFLFYFFCVEFVSSYPIKSYNNIQEAWGVASNLLVYCLQHTVNLEDGFQLMATANYQMLHLGMVDIFSIAPNYLDTLFF